MVPKAQREPVRETPRFGDLIGGQRARGHRHLDMLARLRRRVGGESELDLRLVGDRTRCAAEHRLEPIEWGFVRHKAQASDTDGSFRSTPGINGWSSIGR